MRGGECTRWEESEKARANVLHETELILDQNNYTDWGDVNVDYPLDTMESILIYGGWVLKNGLGDKYKFQNITHVFMRGGEQNGRCTGPYL